MARVAAGWPVATKGFDCPAVGSVYKTAAPSDSPREVWNRICCSPKGAAFGIVLSLGRDDSLQLDFVHVVFEECRGRVVPDLEYVQHVLGGLGWFEAVLFGAEIRPQGAAARRRRCRRLRPNALRGPWQFEHDFQKELVLFRRDLLGRRAHAAGRQ